MSNVQVSTALHEEGREQPKEPTWRFALGAFAITAFILGVIVPLSSAHLSQGEGFRGTVSHFDAALGPWIQFDGGWYGVISQEGYSDAQVDNYKAGRESAAAFFPGYPAAVRAVTPVTDGDPFLAEIAVTVVAGALLMIVFLRWCRRRQGARASQLALIALLAFPYGWYLIAAPYGDALFLLATIGAFLLVEDDRPVLAGLLGAVATATRPVGFAVIVGLAVLVAEKRGALQWLGRIRFDRSRLRRGDAGVLLSAVGAGAFMVYEWFRFGSPLAYSVAQRGWDHALDIQTVFKIPFFDHVLHDPRPGFVLRLTAQGVLVFIFLAAVPAVWRRFGAGYGLYTAVVLALPTIGSATFISTGRYVLAAFPVFALAGEWLAERSQRFSHAALAASALTLCVFASFYGRSFFMS